MRKENKRADITVNALALFIIAQGIKSCPKINGHISFNRKSANGVVKFFENIDISVPTKIPDGGMIPVTIKGCERMTFRELAGELKAARRRATKTNFDEALFEVGVSTTLKYLRRGRVDIVLARLLGATLGKAKTPRLKGRARRGYYALPETERLAKRGLEPGTITVSNFGSLYHGSLGNQKARLAPLFLQIIPPQICVIAIGAPDERPGVVTVSGEKKIAPRTYLPFTILFDHRALDYGDLIPFMERLDEIFSRPGDLDFWL